MTPAVRTPDQRAVMAHAFELLLKAYERTPKRKAAALTPRPVSHREARPNGRLN